MTPLVFVPLQVQFDADERRFSEELQEIPWLMGLADEPLVLLIGDHDHALLVPAGIVSVAPVLPEDSLMNSTMPLTELWMHHNAGLLDHAALARSSCPVFPSSLFIDRLTVRFRFLRLRTVDGDRITGKPDSSISAPFYCFASHACEEPVFEWV